MINKITVSNFKVFGEQTTFRLGDITLLTGINGHGKSTLLQTLLLLKQTIDNNISNSKILLNGDLVELGAFRDIKNYNKSTREPIVLQYNSHNGENVRYLLGEEILDEQVADIFACYLEDNGKVLEPKQDENKHCVFQNLIPVRYLEDKQENENAQKLKELFCRAFNFASIHYVSADRIGPKLFYSQRHLDVFSSVGHKGEYTANAIYKFKDNVLELDFTNAVKEHFEAEELGCTVELQIEFWLSKMFGETKIKVQNIEAANLLTLSIFNDNKSPAYFKPTNVGYGYTYALPIIVASLIAKKGEILIVENPEAHLHPCAQSVILKLLVLLRYRGVQVLVESHSDHVLNSLRLSVLDKIVEKDDVSILYFDKRFEEYHKKIELDQEGQIDDWPDGFFDQSTNDLNRLFGIM